MEGRRAALTALLGMAPIVALAQAVASPPLAPLPPEEARAVYAEAVYTHDGFIYSANVVRYSTEERAREIWSTLQEPPNRMRRFTQVFPKLQTRNAFLFTYDPALRARLVTMEEGERSGVVQGATGGWYIAELVGTRPSGPLQQDRLENALPGLVAAGLLPSAAQLQSEPELRMRTQANRIQTVSDLDAAAGVNVNQRLSNEGTLLQRAIFTDRRDLLEGLLKRGADPNLCARKFCPLTLAIFRKQPQMVDMLLKAGASPNQVDPARGAAEGPLGAAAYMGDLELAGRLIAGGARLNGDGGETPLMAAAAAGKQPMVEFLVSKGADPLAVGAVGVHRQTRGLLEAANNTKNAEFIAWVRKLMLDAAQKSGDYAWQGWVEQDGKRVPIDGQPVTLKRAPFSFVFRIKPDAMIYAASSTDRKIYDEFARQKGGDALRSTMNVGAEGEKSEELYVYEPANPPKADERWGTTQNWFRFRADHSRFSEVRDTPQGKEYVKNLKKVVLLNNGDSRNVEVAIGEFKGGALYVVLGTRVRMTMAEDEVFGPQNLEIRFQ